MDSLSVCKESESRAERTALRPAESELHGKGEFDAARPSADDRYVEVGCPAPCIAPQSLPRGREPGQRLYRDAVFECARYGVPVWRWFGFSGNGANGWLKPHNS